MVIRSHDGLGKGSVYVTPSVGDSRRTERDGIPCSGNNRYIDRPKKGPGRKRERERERQKKKRDLRWKEASPRPAFGKC